VIVHPDDVEFWAGGTIACWTDAEVAVTYQYCVLTDEGAGGYELDTPHAGPYLACARPSSNEPPPSSAC
jgi:LmbE family N-acetylglucosaminyl deacetylase